MKFARWSFYVLVIVFIIAILGFIVAFLDPNIISPALFEAAQFAAALAGFSSIIVAVTALYATVSIKQRLADEVWSAKLNLEETLHMFTIMLITDLQANGVGKVGAKSPIYGQALRNLSESLANARKVGVYRALYSLPKAEGQKFEVAAEMVVLEAQINYDLAIEHDSIGQAVIVGVPSLYDALREIKESDFNAVIFNLPYKSIQKLKDVLNGY